jgi:hypothetical protein
MLNWSKRPCSVQRDGDQAFLSFVCRDRSPAIVSDPPDCILGEVEVGEVPVRSADAEDVPVSILGDVAILAAGQIV